MKTPHNNGPSSRRAPKSAKNREMLYERLEDRVLFDAVPDAPVDPDALENLSLDQSNAQRFDTSLYADDVKVVSDASLTGRDDAANSAAAEVSRELVLVDTSVENYQQLVDDLLGEQHASRNIEVVTIDGAQDGIEQISATLARYSDLDALHIVSHGDDFGVQLGDVWLTPDNLGGYAAEIAAWGNALTPNGDLLFLGCDLASSPDGRELLQSISTLTGTDVAASIDDTGNAARGGNWDLEFILGQMETSIAFSEDLKADWKGLLAPGPDVAITTANPNAQIGEDVRFTVTFDNTAAAGSGDTGFGPFIDLLFPVNGADGASGTDVPDGLDFQNATYLGQPISATELTFVDVDGAYNDNGTAGDPSDDFGTATLGYVTHPFLNEIANELQFVSFGGAIDGGILGVELGGQSTSIDLSATGGVLDATTLQTALESLSSVGVGNVSVTGDMSNGLFVEFVGALAQTNIDSVSLDNTLLENGGLTTNPHGSFAATVITNGDAEVQAKKIFGRPGDKLVVLELPFGSVTPEQPEVAVTVNATMSNLADLYDPARPETELTVAARSGFRFGTDALNNADVDPPLLSDIQDDPYSWARSASIRPSLITVETDVTGGESETSTGPNNPRTFSVRVDIPDGQTIQDLDISDSLPNNIVFLSLENITSSDGTTNFTTNVPSGTNVLGNPTNNTAITGSNGFPPIDIAGARDGQSLVVTADSITGGPGNDITISFQAYVTEFEADSDGNPTAASVIPVNGEDDLAGSIAEHTATAVGNWVANDARDIGPSSVDNATATPHSSRTDAKSIAVQKSVRDTNSGSSFTAPGNILEYTLSFQISDYFTFGDLVLTDTFSDGQRFYNAAGFEPTFTLSDFSNSYTDEQFNIHVGAETSATTQAATDNFIVDQSRVDNTDNATELGDGTYIGGAIDPTDGTTTITIELSERLQQLGEDGILQGGHTLDGDSELLGNNVGRATGRITFYTIVQQDFSDDFVSGDRSVDHDDVLTNVVAITGSGRENAEDGAIDNTIGTETDNSAAAIGVEVGTLTKDIFAINGNTTLPADLELQPGDTITYRLSYTLPNSDFENLTLTDFLPLPALVVDDFDGDDVSGDAWSFDSNGVFDATPGVVELGPNDTFFSSDPGRSDFFTAENIEADAAANSLKLSFGTYDDPLNQSTQIDLLFTVTVQDDAFADGLYLTNIARAEYGATNQTTEPADALVQIQLSQPTLNIKKGVVATDDASAVLNPVGPTASNEFQQLTYTGSNTNSTFRLTFGGQTTGDLSVTATAASVQTALRGLSTIGNADVVVTGNRLHTDGLQIEFTGALAGADVAQLVASTNDVSGIIPVSVSTPLAGGDPIVINGVGSATPFSGRITSSALAERAIDLNLVDPTSGLEAGDTVRFMIVVENTGHGKNGAFDVQVRDQLPPEFEYVAGSLSVVDGTGAALTFTSDGTHPGHALFGSGIMLDDPGATPDSGDGTDSAAIDRYHAYRGRNLAIITYDAQLIDSVAFQNDNVQRAETITNQAVLVNYAGREGADDHTPHRNEVQTITAAEPPIGGTYTLTFAGQTTNPIAYDADRNAVKAALTALSSIGAGNVRVAGQSLVQGPLSITFIGELSDTNVSEISIDETLLTRLDVTDELNGNTNEVQTLQTFGNVAGGYFTLSVNGETTSAIGFNATAATVQTALEGLASIGAGDVSVTGVDLPSGTMTIEFVGTLAAQGVDQLSFDDSSLLGGGGLVTATQTPGSANEFQTLDAAGTITGGTFTVTFNGQTTSALNHNATRAQIQTALESLSNIGAGNVNVTGGALPGSPVVVEFQGALANTDVSRLIVDGSALTTSPLLDLTTTTQGSYNETQRLISTGTLTSGDFTLTFDGETTAPIAFNADAATIQAALEQLNTVLIGSVDVSGNLASGVEVNFTGALTQQNVSQLVVDSSGLTGGSIVASTTKQGAAQDPTDDASIVIRDGSLTKAIVSTSEAHTGVVGGIERVTIGEIVRYRIEVELPGGTHTDLRVYDNLPTGLAFIDDGTATMSFISDTPGSVTSTIGAGTLPDDAVSSNSGNNRDNYSNGRDVWFKLGNIVNTETDTNAEYAVVEFNALVMNNTSSNAGNAKFNDVQLHVDGSLVYDLPNASRPRFNVAEPAISTPAKQVKLGAGTYGESVSADAGDVVDFRVTFSNGNGANNSDAFEVRLLDALPADVSLDVSTIEVYIGGVLQAAGPSTYTDSSSAATDTIDLVIARINKGQNVEVRYSVTLDAAVTPNETLTNTANVTWTSLPGDFGTTNGSGGNATGSDLASLNNLNTNASGTDDGSGVVYATDSGDAYGERNGTSAGGHNDYRRSDTANIAVAGTKSVTKTLVATSIDDSGTNANNVLNEAVIGEIATYTVTVNFNEGTMPNSRIIDVLDPGLAFVGVTASSSSNIGFTGGSLNTPTVSADGRTITWDLGTVTDTAAGDVNGAGDTDGSISITYQAIVTNVIGNQSGSALNNSVTFSFDDDPGTAPNPRDSVSASAANISIIEPAISITKAVALDTDGDSAFDDGKLGDAGDAIQYTITLTNNSGVDAFDIDFSDALPTVGGGTSAILGATLVSVTDTATTGAVSSANFTLTGSDLTGYVLAKTAADIDMLASQVDGGGSARTITFTITGTIASSVIPNQGISNTATVDWTSLDGTIVNPSLHTTADTERTGADGAGAANLNNYSASASDTFAINEPGFTKHLVSTDQTETSGSNVTIGEVVTYALKVSLPEGVSPDATIVDILPPGLNYQSFEIITDHTDSRATGLLTATFAGTIVGGVPAVTGGASAGDDVTFTFGQINVTVDNDQSNNAFLILVNAQVADVATNTGYAGNQTTLVNNATIDFATDGTGPQSVDSTISVVVVEPSLEITKEFGPTVNTDLADSGDTVTINLTVSNADGNSAAYEVAIEDTLNPLHYDLGSVNLGSAGSNYPADFSVSFDSVTGLLRYSGGDIAAGASVTFSVTVDLLDSVSPNSTLTNTARITDATSLEGTVTGERNDPDADNDGSDVDTDTVRIRRNSLAGFVWDDANNDGIKQGSESGIGGVEVRLTGTDHHGVSVDVTVTSNATTGAYLFDNLRPGTYQIQQDPNASTATTIPAGFLDGRDTIGTPGGTTTNDFFTNISLPTGSETFGTNNNFGEIQDASLSGSVYHDADNDGVRDTGETGLNGIIIQLTGVDDRGQTVSLTQPTSGGGLYTFSGLRPSNGSGYTITQLTEPAGYFDGIDSDGSLSNGDATTTNNVISSINVVPGDDGTAYNFGEVQPSALSGYVYHDSDNDGDRSDESASSGIQNSRITLTGTDDLGNNINTFVDTNSDGYFEFTNLRPSNASGYTLTQTSVPAAYIDGRDTIGTPGGNTSVNNVFSGINVTSGTNGTENNFGELLPASLTGFVFNDHDNDGSFDTGDGETGIAGVAVRIQGTDDLGNAVDITLNTSSPGAYTFDNLRPDDGNGYRITETQPAEYTDGQHADGSLANGNIATNDVISSIEITSGSAGTAYNFAELGTSISGIVYVDDNQNGSLDAGEATRLGGVTVELFDLADPLNPVSLETVTTASNGTYSFDNLPAGDYRIVQTQPAGYGNGSTNTLNLTLPLTGSTSNNFGEELYDLGDTVYFDANNNGVQDGGEQGIANVDVTLQFAGIDGIFGTSDDPASITDTTDGNGGYGFTELFVGHYTVTIDSSDLPAGITGTDETDDGVLGTVAIDGTANISIDDTSGHRSDVDFGYAGSGIIGNFVFLDVNNDGNQDGSEPGLANITVNLTFAGADGVFGNADDLTLTTTTNASGAYSFANLPAGDFRIAVDSADTDLPGSIAPVAGAQSISGTANVTLANGETNNNIDFGFAGTRTLGDFVWLDRDGSWSQDANEPGLPDVDITLLFAGQDGIFGNADDVTLTDTTDANGAYLFENLPDGDYQIRYDASDLPAGLTTTYEVDGIANNLAEVTINGANRGDVDFGFEGAGTIGDFVFFDTNGDGVHDLTEAGLVDITVNLTFAGTDGIFGNDDDMTISTATDMWGGYQFDGLPDGNFRVAVDTTDTDLPGSIAPTSGADSISGTANVSLNATNRTPDNIDFGFTGTHTVGDFVWFDSDNDGNQDAGEPRVANIGVTILFAGQDGIFGNADDESQSTTTDGNGAYSFTRLSDGNYRVSITDTDLPTGFVATHDVDGSLDNRADFVINGATRNDIDFGYAGAQSLGDRFWYDANANGLQDAGEPGISGVDVTLRFAGKNNIFGDVDDILLNTTTSGTGTYNFANLPEGDYRVTFDATDLPNGMTVGTFENDDASPTIDGTANVGLGSTNRDEVDFGFAGSRTLGDFIFFDANNNGNIDTDEPGFADVEVTLLFAGQDGVFGTTDDVTRSTITAADGSYSFANLPNGDFRVSIDTSDLPAGVSQTFEGDGTTNNQLAVNINGNNIDSADFGFSGSGSIGNFVWLDANGDGVQDSGEPGLANITVDLTFAGEDGVFGNADDFVLTTVTSASGAYLFNNLPAGAFRIAVDAADTDLPGSLSPVAGTQSVSGTANVTLVVGEVRDNVDFGFTGDLTIGDRIWYDANGDGVQAGTNEPGLTGVAVSVVYAGQDGVFGTTDDITKNTTTAANGVYSFSNLSDGNYRIIVDTADLPNGAVQSFDVDDPAFAAALDDTARITLAGSNRSDADFGYRGSLQLGDSFFHDMNADGIQDSTDPGIAGVDVTATFAGADGTFGTADDFALTTTTNSLGAYLFDSLFAGDYRISYDSATLPSGMDVPTLEADDTSSAIDGTANIILSADRNNVDFGFRGTRTVGDRLWFDANGDGIQDATNEPGFAGVEVVIVFAGPNGIFGDGDDASLTTTTAADGTYSFANLPNGTYRINYNSSDLPAGITQTYEQDGSANNQAQFTINGSDRSDIDFGFNDNASISNQLWYDVNGDGVFNQYDSDGNSTPDTIEPGLAGILVTALSGGTDGLLSTTADNFTLTTTTSADGTYVFSNLPQGEYAITVNTTDLPPGFVSTHDKDDFGTTANDGVSTVALGDDETDSAVDFGFRGTNSVGDIVWFDRNGDGVQDAVNSATGEPGLGGVTVVMTFAGADGDFATSADNVTLTTTTNADGAYSFDNLFDGNYRIAIDATTLPTAMIQTFEIDGVALGDLNNRADFAISGGSRSDIDFGYSGNLTIGDTVWYDVDGDGIQTSDEPGLNNIDVNLTFAGANGIFGDADDFVLQTTTNSSGAFSFDNLPQGDYRIAIDTADLPSGLNVITAETDDSSAANDGTSNITLTTNRTDVDFGFRGIRTLGDRVWFDANGDGVQEATNEPGLGDVRVNLLFAGQDGAFGTADDVSIQDTTDANGNYGFAALPNGDYRISVENSDLPAGMSPTFEIDGTTNNQADVTIANSDTNLVDFGFRGTGTISDNVWHDVNGDGVQDSDEPGIASVTVNLTFAGEDGVFGTTDDFALTTTTDASGNYAFNNLPAGSFRVDAVEADIPASRIQTFERNDSTNAIAGVAEVSLGVGQTRTDVDFGYAGTLTIGDRVWFDANNDGLQTAGEPGLPGVEVSLLFAGPDNNFATAADNVILTTTTDATGAYAFENLFDGDYTISVTTTTLPGGTVQTSDQDDAAFGPSALDHTSQIRLAAANRSDADFGYRGTSSIGDLIAWDVDSNGVLDGADRGLPGVDVTAEVDINGDNVPDYSVTVTTDINGAYLFENLIPGSYTVTVDDSDLPPGTSANPTVDPNGTATPHVTTVILSANESNSTTDFAYTGTGTIGDRIWLDTNGDGNQDATNEPGLANVGVTLTWYGADGVLDTAAGGDDEVFTTTTDADGTYSFNNLPGGNYQVDVEETDAPGNTALTTGNDGVVVTLPVGGTNTAIDFGFQGGATGGGTIGDFVFYDFDNDGVFNNSDVAYPNIDVTITADIDGDGINETFAATTDANGLYEVAGLPYGSYTVSIAPPNGTSPTFDATGAPDNQSTVTLDATNNADSTQDFGLTGTGTVGDTVFYDEDGNGVQDGDEVGIPGVTLQIDVDLDGDNISDFTATAVTDQDGKYSFANIPEGRVTVSVASPAGSNPTTNHDATVGGDNTNRLSLSAGSTDNTSDFGFLGTGSIGNIVFFDADADGIQDDGTGTDPAEPGLPGVQVFLDIDFNGDGTVDRTLQTTTASDGTYRFDNLPAGDYTVRVTQPAGTNPTADNDGIAGTSANQSSLTLAPAASINNHDFGYTGTGSITDTVFFDIDNDATEEVGSDDRGLPNVDVTLAIDINGDGITDYTTSVPTDTNGDFTFTNLIPGTYTITTDPTDMPPGLAANPTVDKDGVATPHAADYTVTAGDTTTGPGFGFHATPDYDIVKTGNGNFTSASPGDTVSYTIVVTNIGELDGRNVTITDNFPTGVLRISAASGGTIDANNGTITWNLAALAPTQQQILTVTAVVIDPIAAGINNFTNSVTVDDDRYNGDDPDTTNNSSSYTATLDAAPDYRITKSNGPAPGTLSPGDSTTYTITVTNDGNQDGTGIVVTDRFPVGVLQVTNAFGGTVDAVAGTITWTIGDLNAGDTVILQPEFSVVSPATAAQTTVTNNADVDDDGTNGADPNPGNNTSSDTDALDAVPDYRITKTLNGSPASVTVNDIVTYSILVENIGDQNGTGVIVTDNYPTNALTNVVAPGATIDTVNGTITWNIGDLNGDGDSVLLTVTARVRATLAAGINDLINSATVTDDLSNGTDPTPTNNADNDVTPIVAQPDLAITKTDHGASDVRPGETVVYTISYSNIGVQEAVNVVITETVPEGSTFFADDSTLGWVDMGDGTFTFDVASLPAGASGEIEFAVTVNEVLDPNREELQNHVTIADDGSNGADANPDNNTAEDTTPLQVYSFDSFQDFSGNKNDIPAYDEHEIHDPGDDQFRNQVRPIQIDTVYTGIVDPGTTLSGKIYDQHGRMIGEQIVMADSAGNWLMQFPTVVLFEAPHEMRIDQTLSVQNSTFDAGFNLRRFFHPAVHTQLYMNEPLSIGAAFYHSPNNVLDAMHAANNNPLGFGWMHHAYELVVSSTNTSAL